MGVPGYTCLKCKLRPSEAGAVRWYLQIPLMLFFVPFPASSYCSECAAGINALGLVLTVIAVPVVFVLSVILIT